MRLRAVRPARKQPQLLASLSLACRVLFGDCQAMLHAAHFGAMTEKSAEQVKTGSWEPPTIATNTDRQTLAPMRQKRQIWNGGRQTGRLSVSLHRYPLRGSVSRFFAPSVPAPQSAPVRKRQARAPQAP